MESNFKEMWDSLSDEQKDKVKDWSLDDLMKFAGDQDIELPVELLDTVSGGLARPDVAHAPLCRLVNVLDSKETLAGGLINEGALAGGLVKDGALAGGLVDTNEQALAGGLAKDGALAGGIFPVSEDSRKFAQDLFANSAFAPAFASIFDKIKSLI